MGATLVEDIDTLASLSLVEAAAAVADGSISAVALTEACIARTKRLEPKVNSVIWLDEAGALEAAEAADAARRAGAALGPLHGVPMAHKDMYYKAGQRSSCGSAIRRDFRPSITATVLERLEGAGAVTFGGLNMAEFAQNPTGHNRHYGDCLNPWNAAHITGGSSSGSGAAVAARFAFMALGSDTGGSIRLPASACGVTGLKPTQTRISRYGVMPLSFSCDNVGPLARSARDCARVMTVMAGHDPKDPTSAREAVPDYEAALDGDLRGLRIGVPETWFLDGVAPSVLAAMEAALAVLQARGASVTRITLPLIPELAACSSVVSRCEAATIHGEWMREYPQDYAVHLSARLFPGYGIPATHYIEALSRRGPLLQEFCRQVFSDYDLLVTPTIATELPTRAETDIDQGPPGTAAKFMAVASNTRLINYLGLPAISVPCGFDSLGLPVGLQIIGRPFAEARVMQAADAFQQDTDWHLRMPSL
ncbi:amidase [Roseomonas sp. 18066]|uniref:amidase n=1 Tax=Roseomonas sp. 18066 TaxID=2681412 RepID=UPI00135A8BE7|nr:amidase [Roseomonas sp. 18066]